MKKLFLFNVLMLLNLGLIAQGWVMQQPYPTFNHLHGVSFPSASVGYIVGDNGTFMKSTDQGVTWRQLNVFPEQYDQQISNVNFLSVDNGFIGLGNRVYKTTDGGETWEGSLTHTWGTITGTFFIDDTTGYAYGYYSLLYKTTNAGKTWNEISFSTAVTNQYSSVKFADYNTGYLIDNNLYEGTHTLKQTLDGGVSWTAMSIPDEVTEVLYVEVIGPNELWIASRGWYVNPEYSTGCEARIYHTTDGGITWTSHSIGMANSSSIESIHFINEMEGRVIAFAHTYSTSDGGQTWEDCLNFQIRLSIREFGVSWVNPDTCYIAGYNPSLLRTYDNGSTMEELMQGADCQYECVYFKDTMNGYAAGWISSYIDEPVISYTQDGGTTWHAAQCEGLYARVYDMHFFDANNGMAVYSNGFFRTTDGGLTWSSDSAAFSLFKPKLEVTPEGALLCAGHQGAVIKSTDNGENWVQIFAGFSEGELTNFQLTDDLTGYMAIAHQYLGPQTLYKTEDGGFSWTPIDLASNFWVRSMGFFDNMHGMVSMDDEALLYTLDGGLTWTETNTPLPFEASYIKMFNPQDGIVVGNGKYVATTHDGGASFQIIYNNEHPNWINANSSFFVSMDQGWSVGYQGMIQKFDSHITSIYQPEMPNQFSFVTPNPATNYIYSKLKGELFIRNLTGATVLTTLVNPNEAIGISHLPAGIYIVTVVSNDKSYSMKLVKR